MHLLADESVDQPVVEQLRADGHEVLAVAAMEPGLTDEAVLTMANQRRAVLLTADKVAGTESLAEADTQHNSLPFYFDRCIE
ncbi:MAG TPA: DUF5615 family PIN-like protein [Alphaproteobacteria bacterium]|nr:DUF5615 family PIN-like protein [Alphaproteobacteria bacterium]